MPSGTEAWYVVLGLSNSSQFFEIHRYEVTKPCSVDTGTNRKLFSLVVTNMNHIYDKITQSYYGIEGTVL